MVNRGMFDAESMVSIKGEKVRSLLKVIRMNEAMRLEFKSMQVKLGRKNKVDLPSLDVKNRWNSMVDMVNSCYELRDVFESLWNEKQFKEELSTHTLSRRD